MDIQTEKRPTIGEVAKLCGVSKTTVSRFLNGKYENISAETRERIRLKIEELDYRPNRSAQRLKSAQSMLIGCIIGDVRSPFSGLLLSGINRVCEAAGYQVLFSDSHDDPGREKHALQGFIDNSVDGLIINSSGGNDELIVSIHDSGIPVVLADRSLLNGGQLDTVCSDNRTSACKSVNFLFECGYKHVAFFTTGNKSISPRILRYIGYQDAVNTRYYDGSGDIFYEFHESDLDECKSCIKDFRSRFPGERIAILSVNGVAARTILIAMDELGIQAGWDYGICTYDDWKWLKLLPPGITSLAMSSELIGEEAAKLLLDRVSGKRDFDSSAVYREIPAVLKVRGSTPEKNKKEIGP